MSTGRRRPPALPRPVTGVFVRHIKQTSCPCTFAVVWADFEPFPDGGADLAFADDLPEVCLRPVEPLPKEFTLAFAEGAREIWKEAGGGQPAFAARVVLRDALWHEVDSGPESFRVAGRLAAWEALRCVTEDREPRPVGNKARRDQPIPPMPRTLTPPDGSSPA
ncbi:hypothetical protein [Nocardiopsis halotolerans]|uniref:hypothetical protein n=1 Tax=Nocardiopsis halotolerans TaxID=124252 RepID=UPI00034D5386|nr:hypothetical protein [Nocardiopsis halotolerans]